MIPAYRIVTDDKDVTAAIAGELVELRVTDKEGIEADEFELIVSDASGRLVLPKRGVVVRPAMGFRGRTLIEKGSYTIDEVEHGGPPDVVRIKGRGSSMTSALSQPRETSYHEKTLGEILRSIAARHDLKPAIDEQLGSIRIPHLDQTRESDLNFVTRLALDHDALGTVKDGRLVFVPAGAGTNASGQKLPAATIIRSADISHSFTIKDRDSGATKATAQYRDLGAAETREAEVTAGNGAEQTIALKRIYPDADQAKVAAACALKAAQRKQAEISLELALGRPELIAGQPLVLRGWRPEIDGLEWVIEEVEHSLTPDALTTRIKANAGGKS